MKRLLMTAAILVGAGGAAAAGPHFVPPAHTGPKPLTNSQLDNRADGPPKTPYFFNPGRTGTTSYLQRLNKIPYVPAPVPVPGRIGPGPLAQ